MHFHTAGDGPTLLLLHGFLEDHSMWYQLAGELQNEYRVIMPDLAGHGKTPVLDDVQFMPAMAAQVAELMDRLDAGPTKVVGHSMGGYIGLELAKARPQQIDGLCLLHSTAAADSEEKKKDRERAVKVVRRNASIFINESIPNLFHEPNRARHAEAIEVLKQRAMLTPVEGIVASLRGMKDRVDNSEFVRSANFPIHYIIGRNDAVIAVEKVLEQKGESTTHDVFEDVGHMGFIESPDRTLESIRKFLARD